MRFKTFFIPFICTFLIADSIGAKFGGFSRGFGRSHGSTGRVSHGSAGRVSHGSTGRISHGTSYGTSRGTSYGTSHGGLSSGTSYGTLSSKHSTNSPSHRPSAPTSVGGSHPIGSTAGSTATHQNKNTNREFLNAEGGGATRPAQTKPAQPPYPTNSHPYVPGVIPTAGKTPGTVTENKQTSPFQPSAPHENVMKSSTGTLQNHGIGYPTTGQTNPPWSNPYLGANKPITPAESHPPWNNPYLGANKPITPAESHPPWSNPHLGNNRPPVPNSQPTVPGSYPPPIGFKDYVPSQTHSTSTSPFNPSRSGQPPYPMHPMPSNNPWSTPHVSPPPHQTNSMPLGNPYSMHTPGNAAYNVPGQPYYPQQTHVLAQPAVQPFVPGQTVLMIPGQQDSGRGFGQMVKEALVFSTINAGVNRILNPHSHTHYIESKPDATPTTSTHITYNNQYFNTPPGVNGTMNTANVPQGTGATNNYQGGGYTPNTPQTTGSTNYYPSGGFNSGVAGSSSATSGIATPVVGSRGTDNINASAVAPNVSSDEKNIPNNSASVDNTLLYRVSDDDLLKISEELYAKSPQDMFKYIKLNLQTRATSANVTDEAKEPLFNVDPELLEYPTIYVTRSLYERYEHDFQKKLNRTLETRKLENLLIDTFLNTNAMDTAMQWLADRGFIDPDDFERKDVLRRIWFTMFSGSTCGFERVFVSENYGTAIIGVQDWIYFQNQESQKRIDYMGYVDKLDIGNTASLMKLNFQMDGIVRPNATIFVGTGPELEMSLYTICFYARPNNLCPVSLAGTKFNIYTHSFTYFGNEVMDLGLPMF